MAKSIEIDDEFDDGDMLDDFEEIEEKKSSLKYYSDARRRLDQIRADKELDRLIKGDFDDDWD